MEPLTGVWKEVDDFMRAHHIPVHMMLEVTRRCNIHCVHCYNIKDKAQLSYDQIGNIFKQLRGAGTLSLTLTGGEFFTRPDACDVLTLARTCGFDMRLITNGTLITRDKARVLKEVNMLEVGVSLLGATPEIHDRLVRCPGAFHRTMWGIKNCLAEHVPIHIKCTLLNENYHQFQEITRLAENLGVRCMIDPVVSPRDDGDTANLKHQLNNEFMEDFYMAQFKAVPEDSPPQEEREKGLPCEAGAGFGAISAVGDVYPCIQMPQKVGNVFETPFKEIWNNDSELKRLRSVTKDELRKCSGCPDTANRCPGLAYLETGDPLGPSSVAERISGLYKKYQEQQKRRGRSSAPLRKN